MSIDPVVAKAELAVFDDQRFLRDLTSLLALPAFWGGTDPKFVLRTLFEALESVLPIEICYGVTLAAVDERLQILRVDGHPMSLTESSWAPVRAFAEVQPLVEITRDFEVHGRYLRCVRLPIGYVAEVGCIVVGSPDIAFPTATQIALLRMAMSLAGAGLETARVIRERDHAQRAKDEFLAMIGHELRNPLAPIITALRLMALKAGGQKSREQEIIERQVHHLKTLVEDLLDISRITQGKIDLHTEILDVADVVARALETVSPLLEERKHDIHVDIPDGLTINADLLRLNQVLGNLLINAAKYTAPGGHIQVTARLHDDSITIRIIDSGIGLASDLMPRLFEAFVQGPQSLARSQGGLGIGLAVVKSLVLAHGGSVGVHSEGPGRGSEFTVKFPAFINTDLGRHFDLTVTDNDVKTEYGCAAVLVVDDNHDAADLASVVLSAAGYRVVIAYSGQDALECAAIEKFDVILLDIGLPDLDGYAVAAELQARRLFAKCSLIAVTGYGFANDKARSAEAGFVAHLVKPVEPDKLTEIVRHVIDGQRVRVLEPPSQL